MALVESGVKEKIGYITFNRPEKFNCISLQMKDQFQQILKEFKENPNVWVIILTGKGKAFSSGIDLSEISLEEGAEIDALYLEIMRMPKPLIAAVNGFCLAQGAGIALCCDIRIGSEEAQFGWPQARRGISSISGPALGAHYLPLPIALEHFFTGEFINAKDAYRFFLINQVVPPDELMPAAEKLAKKILGSAPLAVRALKEAALQGLRMPLEARMRFAGSIMGRILQTEDAKEGVAAFMEKRQPIWKGR